MTLSLTLVQLLNLNLDLNLLVNHQHGARRAM